MKHSKSYIYHKSSLARVACTLVTNHGDHKKWAVEGDMGSGKTTLIKAMVSCLGSADQGASPTFSIVNEYYSKDHGPLYHMDLYRLKNIREAFDAGIHEILYQGDQYCFIEWPDLISEWMDENWLSIKIQKLDEETRLITVHLST